jgi:hypothetical protein
MLLAELGVPLTANWAGFDVRCDALSFIGSQLGAPLGGRLGAPLIGEPAVELQIR